MRPVGSQNFVAQPRYPSDYPVDTAASDSIGDPVENWAERTYRLASAPLPKKQHFSFLQPHPRVVHEDFGNGGGVTFYRVPGEIVPRYEFTGSASDLNGYRMQPGNRTWNWRKPGWE